MDIGLGNVEQYLTKFENGQGMVPGFTTSVKTRPLVISKMVSYIHEKACVIQSKRTLEELRTFVWKNGKARTPSRQRLELSCAGRTSGNTGPGDSHTGFIFFVPSISQQSAHKTQATHVDGMDHKNKYHDQRTQP